MCGSNHLTSADHPNSNSHRVIECDSFRGRLWYYVNEVTIIITTTHVQICLTNQSLSWETWQPINCKPINIASLITKYLYMFPRSEEAIYSTYLLQTLFPWLLRPQEEYFAYQTKETVLKQCEVLKRFISSLTITLIWGKILFIEYLSALRRFASLPGTTTASKLQSHCSRISNPRVPRPASMVRLWSLRKWIIISAFVEGLTIIMNLSLNTMLYKQDSTKKVSRD